MTDASDTGSKHHFTEHLPEGTELLMGQYRITKYLDSGGFGITYLATDSLERTVVVKECFPGAFCRRSEMLVQPRSQAHVTELVAVVGLFLREARALAKLEHPNIVGVHQVFEYNNTAYMALDFVEGRNLLELVESPGRSLTPRQVRSILEKLLDAVGAVHEAGLLHRDISPDNVIVTRDHDPVLIDFGAARDQATKATQALSALRVVKDGYSPQEFYLAGSGQGPYSDLYSLAATFYHVITGEVPPDSQLRIASHVAGEPDPYVPLREKTSAYDVAFCEALDRAMAILPKDRIQSATDWRRIMNETPQKKASRTSRVSKSIPVPISRPRADPSRPIQPKPKTAQAKRTGRKAPLLARAAAIGIVAGGLALAPRAGDAPALSIGAVTDLASAVGAPAPETNLVAAQPMPPLPKPASDPAPVSVAAVAPDTAAPRPEQGPPMGPGPLADLRADYAAGQVLLDWRPVADLTVDADGTIIEAPGGPADGLAAGWQVTAVDGATVATGDAVYDALRAAALTSPDGLATSFAVTAEDAETGATVIERVPATILYETTLPSGLRLETSGADGAWTTRVAAAPEGGVLQIGDELAAVVASGERFAAGDAAARITAAAIDAGQTEIEVAVRRDGTLWAAPMPLTAQAN